MDGDRATPEAQRACQRQPVPARIYHINLNRSVHLTMTPDTLAEIMPGAGPVRIHEFYPYLVLYMAQFGIDTRLRKSAFLATTAEESGEFRYTKELWGPTPTQQRYEGRADLGNTEPGDGSRYRGRGLIQITGRDNYRTASQALGVDYVGEPTLMETPEEATRTACWWWQAHGCNELADTGDLKLVTRRVNGSLTHFDRREAFYTRALDLLT